MAILQLKIALKGITLQIWRRFLVDELNSFHTLHRILQEVMGWEDYHVYEFDVGGEQFGLIDGDALDANPRLIDSKKKKLFEYLRAEKQRFSYLYDFGDSWKHELIVEKILEKLPEGVPHLPFCLEGKRRCPPEDCGGIGGYRRYVEILKTGKDPWNGKDIEELKEWWNGWEAEEFSVEAVNQLLGRMR